MLRVSTRGPLTHKLVTENRGGSSLHRQCLSTSDTAAAQVPAGTRPCARLHASTAQPQAAMSRQPARSSPAISYNPELHSRTKHIDRRHFFVRECVENMKLSVPFVKTVDNLADFFTKPLSAKTFFRLRDAIMNVRPGEAPESGPCAGHGGVLRQSPLPRPGADC